ncbi:MAG: UDP-N-acetylmuramate dehydrogenase [Defluviitaleaceae bacterium]|nr:UDP-N-acetylmuramate dehydrogenase [Defluviitaleaceae bacterium]
MFDTSLFRKNFESKKLLFDELMSGHTTFKIGGPAALMVLPDCQGDIVTALELAELVGVRAFVMGGGSNLLVNDDGIDAVVIKLSKGFSDIEVDGEAITAQAGVSLARLAAFAHQHGLAGLEFASGIPGSLGGAVYMNAGAYGEEMSDRVRSAKLLEDGEVVDCDNACLGFSYRTSSVQAEGKLVLSATLSLSPGDPREISAKMDELAKRRRDKQPLECPSAGSTFKRPQGQFAGRLIEDAGLKGYVIGGAQVSPKHAGFIINTGGATSRDVLDLFEHIQEQVFKRFGVRLEPEVKIV